MANFGTQVHGENHEMIFFLFFKVFSGIQISKIRVLHIRTRVTKAQVPKAFT